MTLSGVRVSWLRSSESIAWAFVIVALTANTSLSAAQAASLTVRTRGAEHVVVATVRRVAPAWVMNDDGDRLIVSRAELVIEETLKGAPPETLWLEVEGGTLDGITLKVASLPLIEPGERAVFFTEPAEHNLHRPYLRGQGILPLTEQNVVRGTGLSLNEIRATVRGER